MNTWIAAASRLARWWAATYTLGLASPVRAGRRAEIASDVWEHQRDAADSVAGALSGALGLMSRTVRGMAADMLWRVNVEGPKMDIRIPFERVTGALLLAMVVLVMITTSISGYDTSRDGFDSELRRLADLSTIADNMNAFFRALTGVALIAGAAGFYVALRERSRALSTIAAFGLCAAGVLELVAGALQLTFVELAEEYVASSGAHQEQVLVTARAIAVTVEGVTGAAFISLVLSTYVLAIIAGREALVPRWLIGIPILSAGLIAAAFAASAAGMEDGLWFVLMSGMFSSVLWLLIAGLYLLFARPESRAEGGAASPAAAGMAG